jgi:hypothetical protein
MTTVDASDLLAFADELRQAAKGVTSGAPKIVKRGAQNIKTDAQQRVRSQIGRASHLRNYARTITYDPVTTADGVVGTEIGPVPGGQGSLAGIVEFGSARSGPMPHLIPAWEAEAPNMEQAVDDLVVREFRL